MGPRPVHFGDQVTGDSLINRANPDSGDEFFPNATNAFLLYGRATQWMDVYPRATLSHADTLYAMREFEGKQGRRVKTFHTGNFPSILKAAKEMKWTVPTSTPGCPQTNGLAERRVRTAKEGGRTNLLQSGLDSTWWTYAITHHCFARNTLSLIHI